MLKGKGAFVPQERLTIARHFNAGNPLHPGMSAEGTVENCIKSMDFRIAPQPSLSGLGVLFMRTRR